MNRHGDTTCRAAPYRQDAEGSPPDGQALRLPRMVSSQVLFRGEREIGIEHAGSLYRLKITRQGKLILNK